MRLDKYLVENGYFQSRTRALEAIKSGDISIKDKKVKPSTMIDNNTILTIKEQKFYVSRAGKKLDSFLKNNYIDMKDKNALDIGSSTGGFAQIILEQHVKSLDCVDVGNNQLHISLRDISILDLYEQTDIRRFQSDKSYDIITCDVSFISIHQILSDIDRLATNTHIIILYKPQFEVGKEIKRNSKGVVLDIDAISKARQRFEKATKQFGWNLKISELSQIKGKEGNQEYIYYFTKDLNV